MQTPSNTLIVDAYNANPTSMKAALDNFHLMEGSDKMVILGDMKELGEVSQEEHSKIINLILEYKIPTVWLVGDEFRNAASQMPVQTADFKFFNDVEAVKEVIAATSPKGRMILIKGSNSTRLFTLPELL